MDHGNPFVQRLLRRMVLKGFSLKEDGSLVGVVYSQQQLHQCGLAGAVFSQKSVYSPRAYLQPCVFKGLHPGKRLVNVQHFQQVFILFHIPPPQFVVCPVAK